MKKYYRSFAFVSSAITAAALVPSAHAFPREVTRFSVIPPYQERILRIGDGLRLPSTTTDQGAQPPVQQVLHQRLKARFDAATVHSNHLLTAKGADDASWGFVASHFAEIDKDHNGYVTFSEVTAFMDARSPLKTGKEQTVQIVE
ncbi:EF-hand domain-containing protein [Phyllobacterium calauticae]|uniref:EF-hand domain-containing protein n=1 Tax=Phyllobacterium calauticae TaxID=2817027 RepID=UPI001CBBD2C6|nr:EF-hand domain-containing protein [Phyllobacterium calauticae]MBZ3692093.1 hypothetical protein [Phyllobacterium calauticae]